MDRRTPLPLLALVLPAALVAASPGSGPEDDAGPPLATVADPSLELLRGAPRPGAFDPGFAPFAVEVDGFRVPYRVMAVLALPGEAVRIGLEAGAGEAEAVLRHAAGTAVADGAGRWTWTAPDEPGAYALRVESGGGVLHLNALVLHPRKGVRNGRLNGYRIGAYRETPLRGDPVYLPPRGFVELEAAGADLLLSPHLTLGQFKCKQPGAPRYLHVTLPLLLKLEAGLEAVNEAGYRAHTFHVMSGFRTPAYNRSIGNETVYSRHLWGDAADVWVDADGDGEMDDWNRDGRVDREDARILLGIFDGLEGRDGVWAGGLGLYRRNAVHGPFVHVDARGHAARW